MKLTIGYKDIDKFKGNRFQKIFKYNHAVSPHFGFGIGYHWLIFLDMNYMSFVG